jgi:serine protease AprX
LHYNFKLSMKSTFNFHTPLNKIIILILPVLLTANIVIAQNGYYRYWVELKDKDSTFSIAKPLNFLSQKAINRRIKYNIQIESTDLPVNIKYVETIKSKGFRIIHTSKWLNSVTVQTTKKTLIDSLLQFDFISRVVYLGLLKFDDNENKPDDPIDINEALSLLESKFEDSKNKKIDTNFYGKSTPQITMLNLAKLHQMGFMGEGVTIAVLDAGFKNANKISAFKFAFDSGHVIGTKDFIERNQNVFDDDDHGVGVWSCMAAFKPHQLVGTSPKANFWLLRSEYAQTESPIEESHWLAAAEFADSVGADVINSSLGYNTFDEQTLSHQYKDLDGKTTIISRAASMASKKGILVINSAGNEGDNEWKYISAPADAINILTVGGVDENKKRSSFSSIGPTADKRVKPDVVTLGENVYVPSTSNTLYQSNGTSYSSPILAGVSACLLQANPNKKNTEIIDAIKLSASQYYAPDKLLGNGIPDAVLANKILGGDEEFPLKKDILLDAKILSDMNVHLTYFTRTSQKITIVIEDIKNINQKPIFTSSIRCKNMAVNRTKLTNLIHLPKGIYAVYFHSKDGVSSFLINTN